MLPRLGGSRLPLARSQSRLLAEQRAASRLPVARQGPNRLLAEQPVASRLPVEQRAASRLPVARQGPNRLLAEQPVASRLLLALPHHPPRSRKAFANPVIFDEMAGVLQSALGWSAPLVRPGLVRSPPWRSSCSSCKSVF